jgi:AcrR family transcriptional regulator
MARPREFEEDQVLDAALGVFWTKGYEGTSVQDLVDATGLGRASLYGAFGDKQALFARTLTRYRDLTRVEEGLLENEPSVRKGLERLFKSWLDLTCAKNGPRGCYFLLAGTSSAINDKDSRAVINERVHQVERMLERAIKRGQAEGELAKDREPAAVAKFLLVMLQGMATAARGGWGRSKLEEVVPEVLAQIAAPR